MTVTWVTETNRLMLYALDYQNKHQLLYNFRILNVKRHRSHPPHNINSFELAHRLTLFTVPFLFSVSFPFILYEQTSFFCVLIKYDEKKRSESCTRSFNIHDKHVPNHLRALYFLLTGVSFSLIDTYVRHITLFLHFIYPMAVV